VEHGSATGDEVGYVIEGPQGRPTEGINIQVPGAEGRQAKALAAAVIKALGGGDDDLGDGIVEAGAVVWRVVEAEHLAPTVGTVVAAEAGVEGNLAAELEIVAPLGVNRGTVSQLALGGSAPDGLAAGAVGALELGQELGERDFLAVPGDGLGADELIVAGVELFDFGQVGQFSARKRSASARKLRRGTAMPSGSRPEASSFSLSCWSAARAAGKVSSR
jgi:hypothetical protein